MRYSGGVSNAPQHVINPAAWQALLQQGRCRELTQQIIAVLEWFGANTQSRLDPQQQQQIDGLMELLLAIFSQKAFQVHDDLAVPLVLMNRPLANMAAMSKYQTTDACLAGVLEAAQQSQGAEQWAKVLALYSARNQRVDVRQAFADCPALAAAWYVQYAGAYRAGLANKRVSENLRAHFAETPADLPVMPGLQEVFFGSTYVDPAGDQMVKQRVNASLRRQFAAISGRRPSRQPNPKKIAVLSAYWNGVHSIYRTTFDFVQALKGHYHLTLCNLGGHFPAEASLFDEVRVLPSRGGVPDPGSLLDNDFALLFYPDVGMSDESLMLANMRLAPIQATTLGHSVSTWGSEIDYYISGSDVEPPDHPERNYSERLVLLPGMGCLHRMPNLPRPQAAEPASDTVVVNCPWHGQKINFPFLQTMGRIVPACQHKGRQVRLQIFESGATLQKNDFVPFMQALSAVLPAGSFQVVLNQPYPAYMAQLQQGHLALDSWHFGGCNTVSDSLYLAIPMVCREGDRWYNRIGPHMLRQAGVGELVAGDEASYVAQAVRLICDDAWRQSLRSQLLGADLARNLYGKADARHFKAAVDHLLAHHPEIQARQDREPIRIRQG